MEEREDSDECESSEIDGERREDVIEGELPPVNRIEGDQDLRERWSGGEGSGRGRGDAGFRP